MGNMTRKGRNVNGILLLDKPSGYTSNQVLQRVKRLFGAQKAGHTGSLDPLASGLLPICFGRATKMSAFLLDADKSYTTEVRLGITTDTGDASGALREHRPVPRLDESAIRNILDGFTGSIEQIPPMYSAIKHNGTPLYKLAYRGVEIERSARRITIHKLQLLDFRHDSMVLRATCSKGTYIRTLVEDIGAAIGCGAHVVTLRRHQVGPFDDQYLTTMDVVESLALDESTVELDNLLKPADDAVSHWPKVEVPASGLNSIRHGRAVHLSGASSTEWVRIYGHDGQFVALGRVDEEGHLHPKRMLAYF